MNSFDQETFVEFAMRQGFQAAQTHKKYIKELEAKVKELKLRNKFLEAMVNGWKEGTTVTIQLEEEDFKECEKMVDSDH